MDDRIDIYQANLENADKIERARAARYLEALDRDEIARRKAVCDEEYPGEEECPVCEIASLVAVAHDGMSGEVGIGHCIVCSYERTPQLADEMGNRILYERACERD